MVKKKTYIISLICMLIFGCLLSCGIFAAVSKSVSFNLALVTKPNVYFALTITHVNGNAVGADANKTGFLIFDNRATNAGSVVSWATVNQNCIVLNQVMAGANMPDITPGTTITLKVTNYTNEAGKYLHLGLNYLPIQCQDFTMNNGYGVANLAYNASESFTITTQNILANTYVQIPFLAEIDAERFTATINTNQYATMVRNSGTINAGENYTAEFTSTQEKPYYHFVVNAYEETLVDDVLTIVEKEYTFTNRTGILEIPADILLGNITINANSIIEWHGEALAYDPNATFSGGMGIYNQPYLISKALDLCQLSYNTWQGKWYHNTYFKMTNDIILNESYENYESWTASTSGLNNWVYMSNFYGVFDGGNYGIKGVFSANTYGLMGSNYGTVQNLTIGSGFMQSSGLIGGICANNHGTIQNCKNYANIKTTKTGDNGYTGGICGENTNIINNCHNYGNINGGAYLAGICGINKLNNSSSKTLVYNCSNHGEVIGTQYSVGGIAGLNYNYGAKYWEDAGGVIVNCYNTGNVTGYASIGGIAGQNSNGAQIQNCFSTGAISGSSDVGSICGRFDKGTIKNCYCLSGTTAIGGAASGLTSTTTALSVANMQAESFVTTLNNNKTNFTIIYDCLGSHLIYSRMLNSWKAVSGDYPTFA